jgi:hypothetical protein
MATTTNYSWTTPDDTALVKDGASAIRSLGTSIDTTTKNLNPSTTLGDIEYRSSTANTNTRLGIGSTGDVLTVSGGVPAWAAPASGSLTLLSTTTLSGSSTVISSISQSYKQLFIELVDGYKNGNAEDLYFRLNADSTSKYSYGRFTCENSTVSGTAATVANEIILGQTSNLTTQSYKNSLNMYLTNYTSTGTKIGNWNMNIVNTSQIFTYTGSFKYVGTSAISSISFISPANTYAGGTIKIYGVN